MVKKPRIQMGSQERITGVDMKDKGQTKKQGAMAFLQETKGNTRITDNETSQKQKKDG